MVAAIFAESTLGGQRMAGFRVGVATVDVTPPVGLPLLGNFRDDYAARGTHDPLCAKAMVFADAAGNKAARLVVDVCLLGPRGTSLRFAGGSASTAACRRKTS